MRIQFKILKKVCGILAIAAAGFNPNQQSFASSVLNSQNKVLIVLSGVDYVSVKNAKPHPTGFFLPELTGPLSALLKAGYEVVFANPNGSKPAMDKISDSPQWFGSMEEYKTAKSLIENAKELNNPRLLSSFSEEELSTFAGVFLPGGHAPMEDLHRDKDLGRVLKHFHDNNKPTALICHAPIALLSAMQDGKWIYENYKMTVFSTTEEKYEEEQGVFDGALNYYVQDALTQVGGKVSVAEAWKSNTVRDRELITAQNPMSEKAFTQIFLEALTAQKLSSLSLEKWSPGQIQASNIPQLLEVMNLSVNWSEGFSTIFIARRKTEIERTRFFERLEKHIQSVQSTFETQGLRGYIVFIDGDFEIAYQNWISEEAANSAFTSASAAPIFRDAQEILDPISFGKIVEVPGWLK